MLRGREKIISSLAQKTQNLSFGVKFPPNLLLFSKRSFSNEADLRAHEKIKKTHLDYKYFRDNKETVRKNIELRKIKEVSVDKVVELYDRQRAIIGELLRKDASMRRDVEEGKKLRDLCNALEQEQRQIEFDLYNEASKIPNQTHPNVPIGKENQLRLVGEKKMFNFDIKDHLEIGEKLDLIDFESARIASGEKFYYLKNEAALLEFALINWSMQKLVSKGWTPVITPDLAREDILEGCGFQPRGEASQTYRIFKSPLCLVGTSEVTLGGMYADKILHSNELPVKMVGFSHCYRVEVGHRGQYTKGLYRVHQFSKVEMFAITTPTVSEEIHEEIRSIQEELFSELGLHFRVLDMPIDDLGAPAFRKYDIEAWMPSRADFGEISSTSNCLDYQSRRLNIRYKVDNQSNRYVHTVNGTACAVPRLIMAILENFQQADGTVTIPQCLVPYMGGITKMIPKKQTTKVENQSKVQK